MDIRNRIIQNRHTMINTHYNTIARASRITHRTITSANTFTINNRFTISLRIIINNFRDIKITSNTANVLGHMRIRSRNIHTKMRFNLISVISVYTLGDFTILLQSFGLTESKNIKWRNRRNRYTCNIHNKIFRSANIRISSRNIIITISRSSHTNKSILKSTIMTNLNITSRCSIRKSRYRNINNSYITKLRIWKHSHK